MKRSADVRGAKGLMSTRLAEESDLVNSTSKISENRVISVAEMGSKEREANRMRFLEICL